VSSPIAPPWLRAAPRRRGFAVELSRTEQIRGLRRVQAARPPVVCGIRKVWRQLTREGVPVGRDRVGRLMAELGLSGATRTKKTRTTHPAPVSQRPADLVERVLVSIEVRTVQYRGAEHGPSTLGADRRTGPFEQLCAESACSGAWLARERVCSCKVHT
jgi:transposase InsO family protein